MDGAVLTDRPGSPGSNDNNDKTPHAQFSDLLATYQPSVDMVDCEWWNDMEPVVASTPDKGKSPEANVESSNDVSLPQRYGAGNHAQEEFEMMACAASFEAMQAVLDAKAQELDEKEAELRALEESLDARQARINLDRSELQDRFIECMKREDEVLKRSHEAKGWQKRIFDWQADVSRQSHQVFQREMVADQRDAVAAANMHAGMSALGVSG